MQITAAVMEKADGTLTRRDIRLETVELDDPREGEVLIRVTSCGVCGTDKGCIHGLEPYPTPGVLGHEGAGIVEAVGPGVRLVQVGDRVMIGMPFCGRCRTCRRGEPRYCQHYMPLTFSGYRLDGSSPMKRRSGEKLAGRFFQQSSWATHTIAMENQLAKVPERLALARALGATHTLEHGADTVAEIKELTKETLDFSIEATDGSNLVAEAIEALGIRGTCAMVGGAKMTATVTFNHPDVLLHGKRIAGTMGGGGQTPDFLVSLMTLQRDGRFPMEKLVRFYDFADVNRAIDDSDNHTTIKPILRMGA